MPASVQAAGLAFLILCALSVLGGCGSLNSSTPIAACTTPECISAGLRREIQDQCVKDLFAHAHLSRNAQQRINATYRYPLTNSSSYNEMLRMGGRGPSPGDWCQYFASQQAGTAVASRFSSRVAGRSH